MIKHHKHWMRRVAKLDDKTRKESNKRTNKSLASKKRRKIYKGGSSKRKASKLVLDEETVVPEQETEPYTADTTMIDTTVDEVLDTPVKEHDEEKKGDDRPSDETEKISIEEKIKV